MKRQKASALNNALSASLNKRRSSATIRQLATNPPNSVDFSSNDFLSLAIDADLRDAFLTELRSGPTATGSGGSRLLDGNSTYAERLEREIASFHHATAGLLCNSGFDANVGLFSCLPQPGDIILYDEYIHASVHDGMRLSRADKCICFVHNDVSALRSVIRQCLLDDMEVQEGRRSIFVAVEAVYSMDGDVAPLEAIISALDDLLPEGNGHLIVDEAHSTGVFGEQGRGLVCQLGLEDKVLVRLHTFGKALACNGAILLCSPLIRQYLVNYARSLIYTTFMSYPALAAIKASYQYMMQGKTEPLQHNLHMLIETLHLRLLDLQASMNLPLKMQRLLDVPTACPKSPIFSVLSSEPKALAAFCQCNGFVVRGIVPPTVPAGAERIRVCLHAGNTVQQIDGLIDTIRCWLEQRLRHPDQAGQIRARL